MFCNSVTGARSVGGSGRLLGGGGGKKKQKQKKKKKTRGGPAAVQSRQGVRVEFFHFFKTHPFT